MRYLAAAFALIACASAPVTVARPPEPIHHIEFLVDDPAYAYLDSLATYSQENRVEILTCLSSFGSKQTNDTLHITFNSFYIPKYWSDSVTIWVDSADVGEHHMPCIHSHVAGGRFIIALSVPSTIDRNTAARKEVPFDILMSVYGPHDWTLQAYGVKQPDSLNVRKTQGFIPWKPHL